MVHSWFFSGTFLCTLVGCEKIISIDPSTQQTRDVSEALRPFLFEEVFDYHYNQQEKRYLTLKHFYEVPMMIGDLSGYFPQKLDFSFSAPFGAPPVTTMIILWGTSRNIHFQPPTNRVCRNVTYRLLQSVWSVNILQLFIKLPLIL